MEIPANRLFRAIFHRDPVPRVPALTTDEIHDFRKLLSYAIDRLVGRCACLTLGYCMRCGLRDPQVQLDLVVDVVGDSVVYLETCHPTPHQLDKVIDNTAQRYVRRRSRENGRKVELDAIDNNQEAPVHRLRDSAPLPDALLAHQEFSRSAARIFTDAMQVLAEHHPQYFQICCQIYYNTLGPAFSYESEKRARATLRATMLELCRERLESVHGDEADVHRVLYDYLVGTKVKGSPRFHQWIETLVAYLERHA